MVPSTVTLARLRERWLTVRRNIRAGKHPGMQLTGGPLLSLHKQASSRGKSPRYDIVSKSRGVIFGTCTGTVEVGGRWLCGFAARLVSYCRGGRKSNFESFNSILSRTRWMGLYVYVPFEFDICAMPRNHRMLFIHPVRMPVVCHRRRHCRESRLVELSLLVLFLTLPQQTPLVRSQT
jgi:hypothetical protein